MTWLNLPCPMCGMTTTFSLMAHFRPVDAWINQPFGVVLFIATASVAAIAAMEILNPRKRWVRVIAWTHGREAQIAATLLAGMLFAWVYKIIAIRDFLHLSA